MHKILQRIPDVDAHRVCATGAVRAPLFLYVLDFLPDFFDGFHISGLKLKMFCQIILQKNGVAKRS
jgi:hypothetical protein